jgi:mannose-6-phosphate isomerase-like protein (cupin superfamily)
VFVRIYTLSATPWRCGHWNGSPLEIAVTEIMHRIPPNEAYHYHDFHEYYVILHGRAMLCVEGEDVAIAAGMVVMVQPGERHRVACIDPEAGVQWIVIKERSAPGSKIVVPEPESGGGAPSDG